MITVAGKLPVLEEDAERVRGSSEAALSWAQLGEILV